MLQALIANPLRGEVLVLDQRRLPHETLWLTARSLEDIAETIRGMAIRGAPAISIAGAWGLYLLIERYETSQGDPLEVLRRGAARLCATRPTAVNLSLAVRDIVGRLEGPLGVGDLESARQLAIELARDLERQDLALCHAIGRCGAERLRDGGSYLTHCNTGALATAGHGTALGVFRSAVEQGKRVHVYVDETRPYLQGARLTAWELLQESIPATLICDNMAGWLMAKGRVEAVLVGADRVTRQGFVANKIGTYSLSVLCKHHGIPFYVAAPHTTFDPNLEHGDEIQIEERPAQELTHIAGTSIAPQGMPAFNVAFDVTPPELVTAIFTDRGELVAPYAQSIAGMLGLDQGSQVSRYS